MLEPKKPGEGGDDTGNASQQKDLAKQVDSQDMNIEESDGTAEPQKPAA